MAPSRQPARATPRLRNRRPGDDGEDAAEEVAAEALGGRAELA